MKSLVFATLVLSAPLAMTASGQVKSVAAANKQPAAAAVPGSQTSGRTPSNATRARVLVPDTRIVPVGSIVSSGSPSVSPKPDNNHSGAARFRRANKVPVVPADAVNNMTPSDLAGNSSTNMGAKLSSSAPLPSALRPGPTLPTTSTEVYRVGVRDVLDIKLLDQPGRTSTLFTVLEDGVVEYPLAGSPIVVAGLTTTEIASLLRQRIKIFDNPAVVVTVREYASHEVTISGFVAAPGAKVLRREAMPLYTVLAEALILPEAARATITRAGHTPMVIDLKDANKAAALVLPGDSIKVSGPTAAPTEFYFVGGEIVSPGQKPYHAGLTLTQAVLASGGTSPSAGVKVRVSRRGADGRLSSEEYNLRKIQTGKTPDPVVENGDRIEVTAEK